ncbi:MAG: hypothetical protein LBL07_09520 [Tannerella sp.]|jgi:hypothetical protein|nr:hypothetical protein [Tannerella sp.]
MGLQISTIATLKSHVASIEGAKFEYYLYVLDYYNWKTPVNEVLRENIKTITSFAEKNNSVVIHGIQDSHFNADLMSWEDINGISPSEILPALMITTLSPKYFLDRHNEYIRGEHLPKDKFIFIKIGEVCKQPQDVVILLEKIFTDIKNKKKISDFSIQKEMEGRRMGKFINDALILQPTFGGIGIDLKQIFNFFKK